MGSGGLRIVTSRPGPDTLRIPAECLLGDDRIYSAEKVDHARSVDELPSDALLLMWFPACIARYPDGGIGVGDCLV